MPATLAQAPDPISFSRNPIVVKIQGSNYLAAAGVKAVNTLTVSGAVAVDATMNIKYGSNDLLFTAKAAPDDSGLQIPSGDGSAAYVDSLLASLQNNFFLNRDFTLLRSGLTIVFTARETGPLFNFVPATVATIALTQTTAGVKQALQPNFGNYIEVWLEKPDGSAFERVLDHKIELDYPVTGISTHYIDSILHSHLKLTLPDQASAVPAVCTTCKRRYFLLYGESYGSIPTVKKLTKSAIYHVTLGGLSYQGKVNKTLTGILQPVPADPTKNKFLKQGDISHKVRKNQPEYLYFLAMAAYGNISLKASATFSDGSTPVVVTVAKGATELYEKVCFNTAFLKLFNPATYPTKTITSYDVWLVDGATQVTEKRTYVLDYESKNYVRFFGALSSFGSFDPFITYGKGSNEFAIFQESAEVSKPASSSLSDGERIDYGIEIQDTFKVATGWLTLNELLLKRDFYLSEKKYRIDNGEYLPITITSKKFPEKEDGNGLYAQGFEYEYQFKDHVYTEGDTEQAETYITTPVIMNIYYGPAASAPTTSAAVKALPNSGNALSFTLNTGMNKIFCVAIPDYQTLTNVQDNDSEENLLSNYILTSLVIDGQNYKVYTMQNAIAYSTNHQHIITIINA